jgi:hypothetical protein
MYSVLNEYIYIYIYIYIYMCVCVCVCVCVKMMQCDKEVQPVRMNNLLQCSECKRSGDSRCCQMWTLVYQAERRQVMEDSNITVDSYQTKFQLVSSYKQLSTNVLFYVDMCL